MKLIDMANRLQSEFPSDYTNLQIVMDCHSCSGPAIKMTIYHSELKDHFKVTSLEEGIVVLKQKLVEKGLMEKPTIDNMDLS